MKKILKLITVFILFALIFNACEDDPFEVPIINDSIGISSFKIEENNEKGVYTDTQLFIKGNYTSIISDHGIIVLHNNSPYIKFRFGNLKNNFFKTVINTRLIKGETYTIFPFIYYNNNFSFGDTLSFKSNVDFDVIINKMTPKNGFVYDTISISGKNFCRSIDLFRNKLILSGIPHNVISESDTLIKAIISSSINSSTFNPILKTCNIETIIEETFTIDHPVLDSISSLEKYVGESLLIYGKKFHSHFSEIWISGIEAKLNKSRLDIDKLEITIPKGLPKGLLDVKIKILDRIIEKKSDYQSTTPYITKLDKYKTGFLDTITISGNYFLQPNQEVEVLIGEKSQKVYQATKNEIKVIINRYFELDNPKIVLKIGDFKMEESITMLPPQILAIDKEEYHLQDDQITIKTKFFLGGNQNIKIGGVGIAIAEIFDEIDEYGNLIIPVNKWLNNNGLYPKYNFDIKGEIKIALKTAYGSDTRNINIFKPLIEEISDTKFYHGSHIKIEGLDFGYSKVSQLYIDDILIKNPNNSSYVIRNYYASFKIPNYLSTGKHKLKIITGEQPSNEVEFEIVPITVNSGIIPNTGTRKDVYSFEGNNLGTKSSYGVISSINNTCTVVSNTQTKVEFKLPYEWPLENNTFVSLIYGEKIINIGNINTIEPYKLIENYTIHSSYYIGSSTFEYNGELYFLNRKGIFRLNTVTNSWTLIESNMPAFENGFGISYQSYISVVNDEIYFPYGGVFYIYNLTNKQWITEINKPVPNNFKRGIIHNNNLFFIQSDENNKFTFYKYDFNTGTKIELSQPFQLPDNITTDIFYYKNGKIFMDLLNSNILIYDIENNIWEDIGHPRSPNTYFYANNLYYHNNILYLSGGEGNQNPEYKMFGYDLNTKVWSEKTPMLRKMRNHTVYGVGNYLYIGLGSGQYGYINHEMIRYDIEMDPH